MAYLLYKSDNTITPFLIINDNTIDSTSTSINFIGQQKQSYGQPQQQDLLWMLENFSNNTPPSNAILGQAWFNSTDNNMYVCIDENNQTFTKVSTPLTGVTFPSLNLSQGNLFYNTSANQLYVWSGVAWVLVGPQIQVPQDVEQEYYFNIITNNNATSEMWLNGSTNSRLIIPNNTAWNVDIRLVSHRTDVPGEAFSANAQGTIIQLTGVASVVNNQFAMEIISQTSTSLSTLSVGVNPTYNSLLLQATGENGKTIDWNATATLTIVTN
jgi:hypothetical protein